MNCENCMRQIDKETLEDRLLNWQGRDLINYIKTHFSFDSHSGKLQENIEILRSIDKVVLETALARVKGFEKIYENKHILFFISGLLTATVPAITSFSTSEWKIRVMITLCATLFSVSTLMIFKKALSKDNYIASSVLSFREMLEQALEAKTENESD